MLVSSNFVLVFSLSFMLTTRRTDYMNLNNVQDSPSEFATLAHVGVSEISNVLTIPLVDPD